MMKTICLSTIWQRGRTRRHILQREATEKKCVVNIQLAEMQTPPGYVFLIVLTSIEILFILFSFSKKENKILAQKVLFSLRGVDNYFPLCVPDYTFEE